MAERLYDGTSGGDARVLYQDEDRAAYPADNGGGELLIQEYAVFPGIWLAYKEVSWQEGRLPAAYPAGFMEITHCREGGFSCSTGAWNFRLAQGDMSVHQTVQTTVCRPARHYRGVSIIVDPTKAPRRLSGIPEDAEVSPAGLLARFCGQDGYFVMRSSPRLSHIFDALYSIPTKSQAGYLKSKILEVLLFLHSLRPSPSREAGAASSQAQRELAERVSAFLAEHWNLRLTIGQLAAEFYVSPTWLKQCIHNVYGQPVYTYIKAYKMRAAARCLEASEQSVSDIAHAFGYGNSSKSSQAFKDVMGQSPSEYRRSRRLDG